MQFVFYVIGICGIGIGVLIWSLGVGVFGEIVCAILVLVGVTALGFGALLGRLERLDKHLVHLGRPGEGVGRHTAQSNPGSDRPAYRGLRGYPGARD